MSPKPKVCQDIQTMLHYHTCPLAHLEWKTPWDAPDAMLRLTQLCTLLKQLTNASKTYHMVRAGAVLRSRIAETAPKRRVAEAPKQPRSRGRLTLPSKPIFRDAIARSPANAPAPDKQTCVHASFSVGCCQHVRLTALTDLATCLRMHCESLLHPMPAF